MFYAEQPDAFINEVDDDHIFRYACPKETFAMLGKQGGIIIDNAAVAASIAPHTESPIEVFFGAEAFKFFRARYQHHPTMKFVRCDQSTEHNFSGDHTLLIPQYWWRNYRIDWVLKVTFLKQPYFFIECDGQDFHSSEDQLLHDAQKDQAIMDAGIEIFRFSGSQLNRNPLACVELVYSVMRTRYRQECAAGFHRASCNSAS